MAEIDKYGVVAGTPERDGLTRVSDMVEKPPQDEAPSNLAVIGRYILTPDIFDIIRSTPPGKNGEVQLTDALQAQAREGRVLAYQFEGLRFDCGSTTTVRIDVRRFSVFQGLRCAGADPGSTQRGYRQTNWPGLRRRHSARLRSCRT